MIAICSRSTATGKAEGHTIIVASDGEEALAVAVKEKT